MLALVYARTGETDQAITLIERLLTTPGAVLTINSRSHYGITLMDLRLRWEWDPLRSDPRFQKISRGRNRKRFINGCRIGWCIGVPFFIFWGRALPTDSRKKFYPCPSFRAHFGASGWTLENLLKRSGALR